MSVVARRLLARSAAAPWIWSYVGSILVWKIKGAR